MRILLQHTKTGLYLDDSGAWVKDINQALDFGNSQRAIEYARTNHILEAHVVAAFPSGPHLECVYFPIESRPVKTVRRSAARG
jgi:hypothetical protein